MKTYLLLFVFTILLEGTVCTASAAPRDSSVVGDAAAVLDELADLPAAARIPPLLLREADAVVIAPTVLKAGVLVAGRHGRGVLVVRGDDGTWGNPVFVTVTGGSFGFQVGVEATDLVLVIRNRRSLDRILRGGGKLTLGADASVAAGPLGREAWAATDARMRAEILSYSRSRGLFAGAAVEGDALLVDNLANERFYRSRGVTVADIVAGTVGNQEPATTLRAKLARWQADQKPEPKP
jgi:lipid-binding SYLF domain-containing protein